MDNLNLLTMLTKELLDNKLDYEVTLKGSKTTVELLCMDTGTSVGICTRNSFEGALAGLLGRCAGSTRLVKAYDNTPLSVL